MFWSEDKKEVSETTLENSFNRFRENIIGNELEFDTPYGKKKLIYADWTASGRLYGPIEDKIRDTYGPYIGNTHTETNLTGTAMTLAYHEAKQIIKNHVNANSNDAIICTGSGMTGALLKLQRMLGLKIAPRLKKEVKVPENLKPVVFITHMEHHSNQTCWLETVADKVEIIEPHENGRPNLKHFALLLEKHKKHPLKIASITSCSNVTGVFTPYHEIAEMIHNAGGWCFVDFAASAPYIDINMHPDDPAQQLDAIFFSPHKFLGGPGSAGVLIFNKELYDMHFPPEQPGGGTVKWTNPWGEYSFYEDIEMREDGGTPPFLQTIRAALAIKLKEDITSELIERREKQLSRTVFSKLKNIKGLHILADNIEDRLCIFSFYIDGLHYNLGVRLLNDIYGIQVRGGCSCAGTYGHYLLGVSRSKSKKITDLIEHDDLSAKPGWIRMSLHPVMTDEEIFFITGAIEDVTKNFRKYEKDYIYNRHSNMFTHKSGICYETEIIKNSFELDQITSG